MRGVEGLGNFFFEICITSLRDALELAQAAQSSNSKFSLLNSCLDSYSPPSSKRNQNSTNWRCWLQGDVMAQGFSHDVAAELAESTGTSP